MKKGKEKQKRKGKKQDIGEKGIRKAGKRKIKEKRQGEK